MEYFHFKQLYAFKEFRNLNEPRSHSSKIVLGHQPRRDRYRVSQKKNARDDDKEGKIIDISTFNI